MKPRNQSAAEKKNQIQRQDIGKKIGVTSRPQPDRKAEIEETKRFMKSKDKAFRRLAS